jgi:hypothetical protein
MGGRLFPNSWQIAEDYRSVITPSCLVERLRIELSWRLARQKHPRYRVYATRNHSGISLRGRSQPLVGVMPPSGTMLIRLLDTNQTT